MATLAFESLWNKNAEVRDGKFRFWPLAAVESSGFDEI